MTSISVAKIDELLPQDQKFKKNIWLHKIKDHEVKGTTIFNPSQKIDEIEIISGLVVDYHMVKKPKLAYDDMNNPYTTFDYELSPFQIPFKIINKQFITTSLKKDLPTLLKNVNIAIGYEYSFHFVEFDIKEIHKDYPDNWYVNEDTNRKHVSRVKVYGDNIVKDDIFGGHFYEVVPKDDVGFTAKVGNNKFKIAITRYGHLDIPKKYNDNSIPPEIDILKFFISTLKQYIIN